MKIIDTAIPGVKIIEPDVFGDSRGWFVEQYSQLKYSEAGISANFVQDNESCSSKGVVRGLHWQDGAHAQAKLVRVIKGAVMDVAVDVRKSSPTFGQHVSVRLSAQNKRQLFIPRGFAHGFIVLEDETIFSYKCDRLYCKDAERGLKFDDPELGIQWPELDGVKLVLSEKDQRNPLLKDIEPCAVIEA